MKKKIMYFTMVFMSICLIGCTGEKAATEVELNGNAYLAETSSGEIVINCDDEGNPVEIIDANGEVIDLTEEDVKVERDENGEIVSVTVADQTVTVKEKATEENAEKILTTAKETQEKKAEEKPEQKTEEKKVAEEQKTYETASEKTSEKKEGASTKEELILVVNAPEPPSEKKIETTSEEKKEEEKSEQPSEKPSETPSETPSEQPSETPSGGKPKPTQEIMDQFQQEANAQDQEQGQNNYEISASANRDVFNAINAWRVENGLAELSWGSEKDGVASTRAVEQTDLVYNKLQEMNHGYGTPAGAMENLCGGGLDVMNAWKTSPGHNAAMLNENKTKCVVYTGYYGGNRGITVALFW